MPVGFGRIQMTPRYTLFRRGSVFYCEDTETRKQTPDESSSANLIGLRVHHEHLHGWPKPLETGDWRNIIFYTDSNFQDFYYAFVLVDSGRATNVNLGVN
jgi:hypothetical protein